MIIYVFQQMCSFFNVLISFIKKINPLLKIGAEMCSPQELYSLDQNYSFRRYYHKNW